MQISISKLYIILTGLVVAGMIGYNGYFFYIVFLQGPNPDPSPVISMDNISGLSQKLQKAAASIVDPAQKISLNMKKDLQFLDTPLYQSFKDLPEVVPLTNSRGRADPFTPYVAP